MKIFIVEDNFHVQEALVCMLKDKGYEISGTAESAKDALVGIDLSRPDLCIIDMTLDGTASGLELAQHLLDHEGLVSLIITGDIYRIPEISRATTPHLVKPFTSRDLCRMLEDLAGLTPLSSPVGAPAAVGQAASV